MLSTLALYSALTNFDVNIIDQGARTYKDRYGVDNVFDKIVDNFGNGDDRLYGVRNMRVVLNGVLYRGGANNAYYRNNHRNNSNPLPNEGLMNLCEEHFSTAIYLYATNFATAPAQTNCMDYTNKANKLEYKNILVLTEKGPEQILNVIYDKILHSDGRPIYVHCWNGWHASGMAAALALRQFCDVDGDTAVQYWDEATDGQNDNSPTYKLLMERIRKFVPNPAMKLPEEIKTKICPRLSWGA